MSTYPVELEKLDYFIGSRMNIYPVELETAVD
jgi:hypothetical protein